MGLRSLNHFQNNLKRLFASKRLVFSKAIGENATNRFNVEIFRRLSPGFIFWNYSVSQIVDKVSRNYDNLPCQKPFCPEILIKCPIMLIKCPEIVIKTLPLFIVWLALSTDFRSNNRDDADWPVPHFQRRAQVWSRRSYWQQIVSFHQNRVDRNDKNPMVMDAKVNVIKREVVVHHE